MAFLVSDTFQNIIPTTNWMYPATTTANGLPDGFDKLITPAKALLLSPEDALALRAAALDEWRNALSQ
jgi:thiamine transport system substrate-binding protein